VQATPNAVDRRPFQVLDLGWIEVPRVDQQHPPLGLGAQSQPGGDQLRPVADQDAQRDAAQVPGGGGLEGLHVAVRVEPDDRGVDARTLEPGHRAERGGAVAGQHDRPRPAGCGLRDGVGDRLVQARHPGPGVAFRKLDRHRPIRGDRHVEVVEALVEVVRNQDRRHVPDANTAARCLEPELPPRRADPGRAWSESSEVTTNAELHRERPIAVSVRVYGNRLPAEGAGLMAGTGKVVRQSQVLELTSIRLRTVARACLRIRRLNARRTPQAAASGRGLTGFRVEGTIDGHPVSASWRNGRLGCDPALHDRALFLIDMGERLTYRDPPRQFAATLDGPPIAIALTLLRACDRITSFETDLPAPTRARR
jgi:hypothetical protein